MLYTISMIVIQFYSLLIIINTQKECVAFAQRQSSSINAEDIHVDIIAIIYIHNIEIVEVGKNISICSLSTTAIMMIKESFNHENSSIYKLSMHIRLSLPFTCIVTLSILINANGIHKKDHISILPHLISIHTFCFIFLRPFYNYNFFICSIFLFLSYFTFKKGEVIMSKYVQEGMTWIVVVVTRKSKEIYEKYGIMNAVWVDAPKLRIMNNFQK